MNCHGIYSHHSRQMSDLFGQLFLLKSDIVQEMCKEVYNKLGADYHFLVELFQRFGFRFTAELLLMLQAHFCCCLSSDLALA